MVCVVGRIRDLILQLSKSSIYSTKPVRTHVMNDQALSALKEKHAVPAGLRSCHTAVAGNLIIEGHVPATTIHKAMQSGSGIYGLATPGMPAGSPGMEMGARKEAYDVIAFSPDGSKKVFQRIE
ncbi:DUF411 domain-containing protein [Klebsiella pneumoniae]